jgi:hypothetical protein
MGFTATACEGDPQLMASAVRRDAVAIPNARRQSEGVRTHAARQQGGARAGNAASMLQSGHCWLALSPGRSCYLRIGVRSLRAPSWQTRMVKLITELVVPHDVQVPPVWPYRNRDQRTNLLQAHVYLQHMVHKSRQDFILTTAG